MQTETDSPLAPLHRILEQLAAKHAARVTAGAPLIAALKQAQTIHDAALDPIDEQILDLEQRAKRWADENRDLVFPKSPTFKYADSVLKLTGAPGVKCDLPENEIIQAFLDAATEDREAAKVTALNAIKAAYDLLAEKEHALNDSGIGADFSAILDKLDVASTQLTAKPEAGNIGAAACLTTDRKLNKRVIAGLWPDYADVLTTYGLAVRTDKQVIIDEA